MLIVNNTAGREIGPFDELDQVIGACVRIFRKMQNGVDYLAQVVRRDIGGHADGDTGYAVQKQGRQSRRQYERFLGGAVIVCAPCNGIFFDIEQKFLGYFGKTALGVTHCRLVIAVDGSPVSLTID